MATKSESLQANTQDVLIWHLKRWNTRLRLARTVVWLPRGLLVGVFVGLIVAFISRLEPWLLPEDVLRNALIAVGVTGIITLILIWLWPRPTTRSAQDFDLRFDLKERISTALELSSGMLAAPAIIREHQLEDARIAANKINTTDVLPLRVRWIEIILLVVAIVVMAAAILIEPPFEKELREVEERNAAAAARREELQEIRETIAQDESLTEEQREEITRPIEEAIEDLEQDNISEAETMAELAEAEQELRDMASDGQTAEERAAQQAAGRELSENEDSENLGEALESNDLRQAAEETRDLSEDTEGMSEEQRGELADQLEAAADQLEETNPEVADRLREAAEALREGDLERAQEALEEAAQLMEEQAEANEEQAEAAERAADQLEQTRQQMVESGQQQGEGQQGEQTSAQPGQSQQSEQGAGQQDRQTAGQPGEQSDQAQPGAGQPSSQQGQQGAGQPGDQQGSQPAEGGSQASSGQGQSSSSQQGGTSQQAGSQAGGAGAGDTGSPDGSDTNQSGQEQPGDVDNRVGDDSMRNFEPVFAPERIGDDAGLGPDMSLSGQVSDDEGDPVAERSPNEEFEGESYVPYDQVFQQYQGEVQRALESDYIPIGMRDIVRAYFTALEPAE